MFGRPMTSDLGVCARQKGQVILYATRSASAVDWSTLVAVDLSVLLTARSATVRLALPRAPWAVNGVAEDLQATIDASLSASLEAVEES